MRYKYDPTCDCAYIYINKLPFSHCEKLDDVRIIDRAADETVIGIELLYVSRGVDVSGLPYEAEVSQLLEKYDVKVFA